MENNITDDIDFYDSDNSRKILKGKRKKKLVSNILDNFISFLSSNKFIITKNKNSK